LESLNKRELEILGLLAEGMSPTQVAGEFGITYKTVANTKWRIKDKLDLRKTADLIRFYLATHSGEADPARNSTRSWSTQGIYPTHLGNFSRSTHISVVSRQQFPPVVGIDPTIALIHFPAFPHSQSQEDSAGGLQ
jgi:DNA-binding CsgD family transcriptional regulator